MPYRKVPLKEGEMYHICTRTICGFKIFNSDSEYQRMLESIVFYTLENPPCKFSDLPKPALGKVVPNAGLGRLVKIVAYCLMPTHIHLILQQLKEGGISRFMNLILKSYSKYFNIKHNRKGPLWEGRFKNVLVKSDEQFLHLTRYVHLNPVTDYLVDRPEDWSFSSYREYIGLADEDKRICDFSDYLDMNIEAYQRFVNDRADYQRQLAKIKHLTIE